MITLNVYPRRVSTLKGSFACTGVIAEKNCKPLVFNHIDDHNKPCAEIESIMVDRDSAMHVSYDVIRKCVNEITRNINRRLFYKNGRMIDGITDDVLRKYGIFKVDLRGSLPEEIKIVMNLKYSWIHRFKILWWKFEHTKKYRGRKIYATFIPGSGDVTSIQLKNLFK